jgi:hypothetical protein
MNSDSIAVINLRLSIIPSKGDPFISVINTLSAFFHGETVGQLYGFDLAFNIDANDPKSLEKHQQALQTFIKKVQRCVSFSSRLLKLISVTVMESGGSLSSFTLIRIPRMAISTVHRTLELR